MNECKNKVYSIDQSNPCRLLKLHNGNPSLEEDLLFSKIRDFLLESSSIYSNIGKWWEHTVLPGLLAGERVCNYIIDENELVALSIGKRSQKSAKLCSLKVKDGYRHRGFGHDLLSKTASQLISTGCKRVHFTISDEIQAQVGDFFLDYGFRMISWDSGRYSKGREELIFAATVKDLLVSHQKLSSFLPVLYSTFETTKWYGNEVWTRDYEKSYIKLYESRFPNIENLSSYEVPDNYRPFSESILQSTPCP